MTETEKKVNTPESAEKQSQPGPEAPATQKLDGDWEATFKGQMFEVQSLNEPDLLALLDEIKANLDDQQNVAKAETNQTGDAMEKGKIALEANMEGTERSRGMIKLYNELRSLVLNGLREKTGEIFFLKKEQIDLITWYDRPEMKSTELNRSPIYNDTDLRDAKHCFLLNPANGKKIEDIFMSNGHKVDKFPSGRGFHAELGGLRMTFLYPDKFMRQEQKTGEIAEQDDKDGEGAKVLGVGRWDKTKKIEKTGVGDETAGQGLSKAA